MRGSMDRGQLDAAILAEVHAAYADYRASRAKGIKSREPQISATLLRDVVFGGGGRTSRWVHEWYTDEAGQERLKSYDRKQLETAVRSSLARLVKLGLLQVSYGTSPDTGKEIKLYEPGATT